VVYGSGLPDRDTIIYLVADPTVHPSEMGEGRSAGVPEGDSGRPERRATPLRWLDDPPQEGGVETISLLGGTGDLYRWPVTTADPSMGWAYGAVAPWRTAGLVDLREVDPTLRIDMPYATSHNFLDAQIYPAPVALLRPEAARALAEVNRFLHRYGLGLLVWDAYRPFTVQRLMWARVPDRRYVADPGRGGSAHNRGIAVDVTLVTVAGDPLPMPTGFDDFTPAAAHGYRKGLSKAQLFNREILRTAMELHGFRSLRSEWWHYTYPLKGAATLDVPLESVSP